MSILNTILIGNNCGVRRKFWFTFNQWPTSTAKLSCPFYYKYLTLWECKNIQRELKLLTLWTPTVATHSNNLFSNVLLLPYALSLMIQNRLVCQGVRRIMKGTGYAIKWELRMGKLKLFLSTQWRHVGGRELELHSFINLILYGGKCLI